MVRRVVGPLHTRVMEQNISDTWKKSDKGRPSILSFFNNKLVDKVWIEKAYHFKCFILMASS
jgi:hypothetical protein